MFTRGARVELTANHSVLLVCGIARTNYLLDYLTSCVGYLDLLQFGDHHAYRPEDIDLIANRYTHLPGERDNKIILTTEKDAVRLEAFGTSITSRQLPVFLLPLEVVFLFQDGVLFDNYIHQFLLNFKV
jgi:tetraacyldisaccharide 4'-kinase